MPDRQVRLARRVCAVAAVGCFLLSDVRRASDKALYDCQQHRHHTHTVCMRYLLTYSFVYLLTNGHFNFTLFAVSQVKLLYHKRM